MKIYGVIMAGGGGTRFWPLSRRETPKQLLNLSGREVMVNEAVDRLKEVVGSENVFVVTNYAQKDRIIKILDGRVAEERVLSESSARNTSACIGYAAEEIIHKYGDGIMVITPSDAYIKDGGKFTEALKIAISVVEESESLVTIGITPTFPASGYGYIRYEKSDGRVKKVLKFVEKPDEETAKSYLKSGDYVWNSGMFVWRVSTILKKIKEYLPQVYLYLEKIASAFGKSNEKELISEIYPDIPSVSIDYGIMEKCGDIRVVPGDFGWSDVGSWDVFGILHRGDEYGNVKIGDVLTVDTQNTTVYSSGRLVAAVGLENLVIVETPDAVLVCSKDKAQDVKRIVEELKMRNREDLL